MKNYEYFVFKTSIVCASVKSSNIKYVDCVTLLQTVNKTPVLFF